jgi:hypothetical protein
LTDGSAVASWPDLAPHAAPVTQDTPAAQPTFRAHGLGTCPGVAFDGARWLSKTASDSILPESGRFTLLVVAQNASTYAAGSDPLLISCGDGTDGWQVGTATSRPQSVNVGAPASPSVATQWTGEVDVLEATYDGETLTLYRNFSCFGRDHGDWTFALPDTATLLLGDGFEGVIGEIIFIGRVLTDIERLTTREYLRRRWLLPAQHAADEGRTPEDALRSLKRYVAVALGDAWEVRLSREEGAFQRPFARVTQSGAASYPKGGKFLSDVIQPFSIYAYPSAGATPDEGLVAAQQAENALYRAFQAGVELGHPRRVPLFNYTDVSLDEAGAWFPRAYLRVDDLSMQPFADPDENRLWTVVADVRLTWRRTPIPAETGPVVTDVHAHPYPVPG